MRFASKVVGIAESSANAKGAEYESQGQARSASPLVYAVRAIRPEGPKYMQYYAPSGLGEFDSCTRGDAPSRLPLAFILRAFGAALPRDRWRCIPRAFGVHHPIRLGGKAIPQRVRN